MVSLQLNGKVAVVTGGGSGIGQGVAKVLVSAGARVVVADISEEGAQKTVDEIGSDKAIAVKIDIRDRASVDAAISRAVEWGGRLDILVNNAGIASMSKIESVPEDVWMRLIDVNLNGALRCCQAAFPYLRQQRGSVVNVSSIAGLITRPYGGGYGPSKSANIALTGMMAVEWGRHGIRVNSVAPGFIETPMTIPSLNKPGMRESRSKTVPLGRMGTPEDIANLVLFLVSDAASYITGETILVDGGAAHMLLANTSDVASFNED